MSEHVVMLDLEERLEADESGELLADLVKRLEMLHLSLRERRRQLNPPEAYRQIQAALDAVDGALFALRRLRVQRE